MKTALVLCVLAVLAISQAAVVKQARSQLNIGSVQPGDWLLHHVQLSMPPIPGRIQSQVMVFRGDEHIRISAIDAVEIGGPHGGQIILESVALGRNTATIRATSSYGGGFNYRVRIWGQ